MMNYEDLRALQRRERNTQKLADFEADFYTKLADLVKCSKDKYNSTQDTCDFKNLDNIYKISKDIFERREQKLMMKILRDYRTGQPDEINLLPEEKEVYSSVSQTLQINKSKFDGTLLGQMKVEQKDLESVPVVHEKQEDLNTVLIRITNAVPKIMSSAMSEMGPFEPQELVKLPKEDAELLLAKNLAEKV